MTVLSRLRDRAPAQSSGIIPVETVPRPTEDEILTAMHSEGVDPDSAAGLLDLFKQMQPAIDAYDTTDKPHAIAVDCGRLYEQAHSYPYVAAVLLNNTDWRHEALETIMPDRQVSRRGSAHDLLERGLLQPGERFVHDYVDYCVVGITRVTA